MEEIDGSALLHHCLWDCMLIPNTIKEFVVDCILNCDSSLRVQIQHSL